MTDVEKLTMVKSILRITDTSMDALLMMDYGEDEEAFLSRVSMAFEAEAKYGRE